MPGIIPEELEEKLKDLFDDPEIWQKFKDIGKMSHIDLIINSMRLMMPIMHDKAKLVMFFEILPELLLNFDELIIEDGQYDKDLYLQLKSILETAYEFNESKTIEIINSYIQSLQRKYPLDRFIYTIGIFRDLFPKLIELMNSTPITELAEKLNHVLFKMIEDNQKEQFDYYFFDWTLKFGYLIEAYYKDFLIAIFKIVRLLEGEDVDNIPKKDLTVGSLLKHFKSDSNLGIIRNAIFHSDFAIDYQLKLDEREIIFKDWTGRTEILTIQEFFDTFFSVFQVVSTAMLFFTFYLMKKNEKQFRQGFIPIIQQIKEEYEPNEVQEITFSDEYFEQLRTELEELYQNMSNKELKDIL